MKKNNERSNGSSNCPKLDSNRFFNTNFAVLFGGVFSFLSVNGVDHRPTEPFKEVRTSDSTLPLVGRKSIEDKEIVDNFC